MASARQNAFAPLAAFWLFMRRWPVLPAIVLSTLVISAIFAGSIAPYNPTRQDLLFSWKHRGSMDIGDGETYRMFYDADEVTKGGMSNMANQMNMPPQWLHYVTVDDVSGAVERVKQHGGKVLVGPKSIPGDDIIAVCIDPQGAVFALHASAKA